MKLIIYYLSLLIFLTITTGFLIAVQHSQSNMSMNTMLVICAALVIYTVAMSLVGEGPKEDERENFHRQIANRVSTIAGTIILSIAILYQLFSHHQIDYWILAALVSINLSKIISLIYLNYKK